MSHFTVLVIGPNPDAQLAPFNERLELDRHRAPTPSWNLWWAVDELKKRYPDKEWPETNIKDRQPVFDEKTNEALLAILHDDDPDAEHHVHEGRLCYWTTENSEGKWDWYLVGGRWRGFFPLKREVQWHPRMLGEPGSGESLDIRDGKGPYADYQKKHVADVCTVGQVDFQKARDEAEKDARETFEVWRRIYEEHGRPRGWAETQALKEEEVTQKVGVPGLLEGEQIARARAIMDRRRREYAEQPSIRVFKQKMKWWACPVDEIGYDEEAYVRRVRLRTLAPFAVVKDGKWHQRGEMGWWGCVSGEMDEEEWDVQVQRLYEDLPPETLLTLVDCHV